MSKRIAATQGLALLFIAASAASLFAEPATSPPPQHVLRFDVPLLDLGYQVDAARARAERRRGPGANVTPPDFLKSYGNPSMSASLALGTSWLSLTGHVVNHATNAWLAPTSRTRAISNRVMRELTFTGSNIVLVYFPLADGWVHEEFHRAALTTGGVSSYDSINSFRQFGAGTISVTQVRDEDLARFKRTDPAGFTRALVAGGEGELLLTRNLHLSNFFDDARLPLALYGVLIKALVADYPNSDANLADAAGAADLRARELRETAIADRDFTGPDYASWAWHLFKPDVPYAALGSHPTGVGLDRYKLATDLTVDEQAFLTHFGRLMYWNYFSPMTLGVDRIALGRDRSANFSTQVFGNAFGYDVNPEVYLRTPRVAATIGIHAYRNHDIRTWGLEGAVRQQPLRLLGRPAWIDGRVMAWRQPERQRFFTANAQSGGLVSVTVSSPLGASLRSYVQVEAKTAGWVAGHPSLGADVSLRMGLTLVRLARQS